MLFAVDIGNSNIHVGFFEGEELKCTFRIATEPARTPDEYALLFDSLSRLNGCSMEEIDGVIIGSVVPSVTGAVSEAVKKFTTAQIMAVGPGLKTGFSIKLDDPAQLGADLVANAAGAIYTLGAPCIVVDFGTATTVSVIGKNKDYLGCAILPGIQMSLDALNNAELLPGVPAEKKVECIGKNTVNSMLAGVIRGQAMAVCGFVEQYKSKLSPESAVVAVTGGFSANMLIYLPGGVKHIPSLTLTGLCAIYLQNKKRPKN